MPTDCERCSEPIPDNDPHRQCEECRAETDLGIPPPDAPNGLWDNAGGFVGTIAPAEFRLSNPVEEIQEELNQLRDSLRTVLREEIANGISDAKVASPWIERTKGLPSPGARVFHRWSRVGIPLGVVALTNVEFNLWGYQVYWSADEKPRDMVENLAMDIAFKQADEILRSRGWILDERDPEVRTRAERLRDREP